MEPMNKQALRRHVQKVIGELGAEEKARQAAAVCEHIRHWPKWQQASHVLAYIPLEDEIDITPLLEEARQQGKQLYIPVCLPDHHMYAASYSEQRIPDSYGVQVPSSPVLVAHSVLDMVLVSGRAFTLSGKRLGRGKGYYDHFLSRLSTAVETAGVAYDVQVMDNIPFDTYDKKVKALVTPKGLYNTAAGG